MDVGSIPTSSKNKGWLIMESFSEDYFDAKAKILQTRINSFLLRDTGSSRSLVDSAIKALIVSTFKEVADDYAKFSESV